MSSYPDHIRIHVWRSGQQVPVLLPILQAQFDSAAAPVRVILGSPRATREVWMMDACLYEAGEVLDLTPDEDIYAVQFALEFLTAEPPEPEHEDAA